MYIAGIIVAVMGLLLLFCSVLALVLFQADERVSTPEVFDLFLFGGLLGATRKLFGAIGRGLSKRSADEFPLVVLLAVAVGLLAVGGILMLAAASR